MNKEVLVSVNKKAVKTDREKGKDRLRESLEANGKGSVLKLHRSKVKIFSASLQTLHTFPF